MTNKELNLKLIELLPEIKESYEEEVSWQDGDETGSHVIFADVFLPFIRDNFDNTKITSNNFRIIENLLELHDEYADEVITLSILESLFYEQESIDEIKKHLGPLSKYIFEQFNL